MDWSSIIGVVTAALVVIMLPLALRRRKKEGPNKAQELCQWLRTMGVKASLVEVNKVRRKISMKRSRGEELVGVVKLEGKNLDRINLIGIASQYGTHYFLDWVVENPRLIGKGSEKKIKLSKKKSPPLWGKVVDVEWRGKNPLVRGLNLDYRLKDRLLQASFKGNIEVVPEPKQGHVRMRTGYFMPSPDLFEALDLVAGHIHSGG